jgi:hypothetical protein
MEGVFVMVGRLGAVGIRTWVLIPSCIRLGLSSDSLIAGKNVLGDKRMGKLFIYLALAKPALPG